METTTSIKKRCTYINDEQKNVLIEFMTKHPELQSGKFSATFTYKNAQKLWEEVTAQLHQIPGAVKEWNKWRKTWQDMRSATKAKNTSIKKHAQGTGGGPASSQVLTEIDQNILTLIGPTVVEGHNSAQESNVQFDWNDEPEVCNVEYLSHDEEIVKNSVQRDNQEVMQDFTLLKSLPSHSSHEKTEQNISEEYLNKNDKNRNNNSKCSDNSKKGVSKEANSIFNVMLNAKSIPQKSGTKRTAAALRYSKSIEQTEKLAEISQQDGQTRKMYYEKKLELYKKKLALKERDVIAKENIYILLEQFLKQSNF